MTTTTEISRKADIKLFITKDREDVRRYYFVRNKVEGKFHKKYETLAAMTTDAALFRVGTSDEIPNLVAGEINVPSSETIITIMSFITSAYLYYASFSTIIAEVKNNGTTQYFTIDTSRNLNQFITPYLNQ